MRVFVKIIKGALIGMSVVVPGVSGGSMAMSMGIYDQLIDVFTVGKGTKKKLVTILPYGLGALLGIAIFAYFIEWLLGRYPLPTTCAFVGLILGVLPMLMKQVRGHRFRASHALILLGTIALMVLLPVASASAGDSSLLLPTLRHALLAALLGVVAAATMIVPGISGSMVLMLLGYYSPVLQTVNSFTYALLHWDIPGVLSSLAVLGPFAVGVALGMVLMARGIRALLRHFPLATYYGIMGLVIASPFTVFYQQDFRGMDAGAWALGAALILAGFLVALLLGKGEADANA